MPRPSQMNSSRRRFLLGAGALAATATIPNALFAYTGGSSRLVVVILRGALDGLAAVPPYGDPDYANLHRELAIAAPGGPDGALALNNTFGLHPSLSFLHERFAAGELVGGVFYQNYLGGAGLMSGSVFGRIAGASAARAALVRK